LGDAFCSGNCPSSQGSRTSFKA